jgi:hypothetical protein
MMNYEQRKNIPWIGNQLHEIMMLHRISQNEAVMNNKVFVELFSLFFLAMAVCVPFLLAFRLFKSKKAFGMNGGLEISIMLLALLPGAVIFFVFGDGKYLDLSEQKPIALKLLEVVENILLDSLIVSVPIILFMRIRSLLHRS